MAKSLAYLDYTFIFDPSEVWGNITDVEKDFGIFLSERGLEGEILVPMGVVNKRVVLISKKQGLPPISSPKVLPVSESQSVAKEENPNGIR